MLVLVLVLVLVLILGLEFGLELEFVLELASVLLFRRFRNWNGIVSTFLLYSRPENHVKNVQGALFIIYLVHLIFTLLAAWKIKR